MTHHLKLAGISTVSTVGAVLIFLVRFIRRASARKRKLKVLTWSRLICPHCNIRFGRGAADAAIECCGSYDGPDTITIEIRCLNCVRYFDISPGHPPFEICSGGNADRLIHLSKQELDAFGTLHVICDFQMAVTREMAEEHFRKVNPRLIERVVFIEEPDPQFR